MKKLYRSHISSADSGGSDAQQADTRQSPQSSVIRGTSGLLSEAVPPSHTHRSRAASQVDDDGELQASTAGQEKEGGADVGNLRTQSSKNPHPRGNAAKGGGGGGGGGPDGGRGGGEYATCLDREYVQKELRWAKQYGKKIIVVYESETRRPVRSAIFLSLFPFISLLVSSDALSRQAWVIRKENSPKKGASRVESLRPRQGRR
jgi:hypothetical protein